MDIHPISGPLYTLLLLEFFLWLFQDLQAAKAISLIGGIITLVLSYFIAFELSNSKVISFLTQLFIVVNPTFLLSSIQAENHMLDTMFFTISIFLLLKILVDEKTTMSKYFILGIFNGLACLTRYTSYSIIPIIILSFIIFKRKYFLRYLLLFFSGFIIISLPWWIYNTIANDTPFHSWQYMNIGSHVFPGEVQQWWWNAQKDFNGILEIIKTYPFLYLKNFFHNILASGKLMIINMGSLALFLVPAMITSIFSLDLKKLLVIYGAGGVYFCLVSQAFVFDQVFLKLDSFINTFVFDISI